MLGRSKTEEQVEETQSRSSIDTDWVGQIATKQNG